MRLKTNYHPVEAEALACLEVKLQASLENYIRALRERIVALTERDGTLPVTFWMNERDGLVELLTPLYESGMRLGMELERSPRAALNSFINLNTQMQNMIQQLARELAQDLTVLAAGRVSELLNSGGDNLLERLRSDLRITILSDTLAENTAIQQTRRMVAAGGLLSRRGWHTFGEKTITAFERENLASRLCI